jgi:hypothetical protein
MDRYLGISYLSDNEPEWTDEQLQNWLENECPKGEHLWDEVLSVDKHYLFCDACGEMRLISSEDYNEPLES